MKCSELEKDTKRCWYWYAGHYGGDRCGAKNFQKGLCKAHTKIFSDNEKARLAFEERKRTGKLRMGDLHGIKGVLPW